jgi:hypothetical protein
VSIFWMFYVLYVYGPRDADENEGELQSYPSFEIVGILVHFIKVSNPFLHEINTLFI